MGVAQADEGGRRRIFVTGGGRGIGAACVRRLAVSGDDVFFSYLAREEDALRTREAGRASGARVEMFQMDVVDRTRVDEVFSEVGGTLDGLVNNVGYMGQARFEDISLDEWRRMLEGNLTGTFNCIQAALPLLTASPAPAIVNITSRLGQVGSTGFSHYAAAKAALIGFTRALAFEFAGRGIRVNAVAPGVVDTPDRRSLSDEERDVKLQGIPLRSFASPDDVAGTVAFLLSPDSATMTGQTLNPSGGAYMP